MCKRFPLVLLQIFKRLLATLEPIVVGLQRALAILEQISQSANGTTSQKVMKFLFPVHLPFTELQFRCD